MSFIDVPINVLEEAMEELVESDSQFFYLSREERIDALILLLDHARVFATLYEASRRWEDEQGE